MAGNDNTIDPMFYIPPELDIYDYPDDSTGGFTSETDELGDDDLDGEGDDFLDSDELLYDESEDDYYDLPDVPDEFEVISQTIRTMPNGSQVIDLVVEVEDVIGVDTYDFRVVKT
jgi:hypothetical protein